MSDLNLLVPELTRIIKSAGDAILEVYHSADPIEIKSKDDDSPVTQADHAAHIVIEEGLKNLSQSYPVLSEEGGIPDFEERQSWTRYWLVDPLDGTKEFINKNDEFTVNIALIDGHEAILGLVYVPVKEQLYVGVNGHGAWKEEQGNKIPLQAGHIADQHHLKVVGSRRHGAEALDALLEKIEPQFASVDLVSMGSSLKICALAEGSADWYPRLALTSEWDTAAAHAVLNAAGGFMVDEHFNPLVYNQKDSLLNPFFHGFGDKSFNWEGLVKNAS